MRGRLEERGFVLPYRRGNKPDLVPVELPQDIDRFVLIDDPDGFSVMLKHSGRWCQLDGQAWLASDGAGYGRYVGLVTFGRRVLRRHGVREMTQGEWRRRMA